jgi:quercetin dioxygenase-like cupin family protein
MAFPGKILHNKITGQEIRFIETAAQTGGEFLRMQSVYRSASKEPVPHYHPQQEEDFEVLEGRLCVRIHGQVLVLQKGDRLHIPRNTVHSMWNASGAYTAFSWKVSPALETEYFLETAVGLVTEGRTNAKGIPPLLQAALLSQHFSGVYRMAKPSYKFQKLLFSLLSPFAYLRGYQPFYQRHLD